MNFHIFPFVNACIIAPELIFMLLASYKLYINLHLKFLWYILVMKALIQRVKQASVTINSDLYSKIGAGMLVLLGVEKGDTEENAKLLAKKLASLRIFEDEAEKMNKSILDTNGEMLVVSQFTLCGDCRKGTRPSFDKSAPPEIAEELYEKFVNFIREYNIPVKTGKFRAMMDVSLINDGPVTFMVEK